MAKRSPKKSKQAQINEALENEKRKTLKQLRNVIGTLEIQNNKIKIGKARHFQRKAESPT